MQFVVTLIHRPDLIILDEPFAGLDPLNVQLMKEMLAIEQARGATVIFSTHVLSDVEEMSERVRPDRRRSDDSLRRPCRNKAVSW